MTSTRRAELQQTGDLQSGELRKNLLNNHLNNQEFTLLKKKAITKQVLKESTDGP